ncbi:MAG: DUF432 domain-containing protein [Deltaproteobacteria bacterium]|nr:MAG: DUF432 domain-containing protein [Deltaproteobacteria bacterium]
MTLWRQPVQVEVDHRARWDFGNRVLWAERRSGQWLIGGPEGLEDEPQVPTLAVTPTAEVPETDGAPLRRLAVAGEARSVELVPRPPPRPIIARPETPLVVPSGQSTTVYVGLPLWVGVHDGELVLHEVPALRLSETWFGTPAEGELCYSIRTRLRMAVQDVHRGAHRATCEIAIRNENVEPLVLERLRLPAPSLAIYTDDRGELWTSPVRVLREKGDSGKESTEIERRDASDGRRRIGEPRQPLSAPLLGRVFNAMWSPGGSP